MAKGPKLLHLFVGVPDDMLRSIGLIVVLAAQLDYLRMQLLQVANSTPIEESAKYSRDDLTKEIKKAFKTAPFDRMAARVGAWLRRANDLFDIRDRVCHSTGHYETRADGHSGFYAVHHKSGQTRPQFTAARLDGFVRRLIDATGFGQGFLFEAGALASGGTDAHDAYLAEQERWEEQRRQVMAEGQRLREAARRSDV